MERDRVTAARDLSVLVVEGQPSLVPIIGRLLFRTCIVRNVATARDLDAAAAAGASFDLVLIDLAERHEGVERLQDFVRRHKKRGARVAFMATSRSRAQRLLPPDVEHDFLLVKPFTHEELLRNLNPSAAAVEDAWLEI